MKSDAFFRGGRESVGYGSEGVSADWKRDVATREGEIEDLSNAEAGFVHRQTSCLSWA